MSTTTAVDSRYQRVIEFNKSFKLITFAVGYAVSSPLLRQPGTVDTAHLHLGSSTWQLESFVAAGDALLLVAEHPRVLGRRGVVQTRPAPLHLAVIAFVIVRAVANVGRHAESQVFARRIANSCKLHSMLLFFLGILEYLDLKWRVVFSSTRHFFF